MSVALPAASARRALVQLRLVDALLLASVFTVTFANVRWTVGAADVNISDLTAAAFVLGFLAARIERHDARVPRAVTVLGLFFLLFLLVYLVGFFNLTTTDDRAQFAKGISKFVIHFALLVCAVAHLARRSESLYWRTLGWLVGGIVANAAYGVIELAVAETSGGNLDRAVLSPIGSYQRGGINIFGAVGGANVYRPNALTLDPNHLGIMLIVPILILLPIYLRLERGHRLRLPLVLTLAFLAIVELATLSRSGLLGLAVGLLVLAVPYRRLLLTPRILAPLGLVLLVVAIVVSQRTGFFEQVFHARTNLGGSSTRVHLELYELLPPVVDQHPLFGLGLNTFSTYFEFSTGKSNWGPHSYYISLLTETGIVGTALFAVYLGYLFRRLGVLRRIGRALADAGDAAAARVRPLAWGLTAALVGTLAANIFYLTMQMYYFFAFAIVILGAPLVFERLLPSRPHSAG
jgi:O-Antigen ligase